MNNKKNTYITGIVFAVLFIWCLISCIQTLLPILKQLSADKELLGVTINDELKNTLSKSIGENTACFWSMLLLHIGSMVFLGYLILVRVFYLLNKSLNKWVMPSVSLTSTVLIFLSFIINCGCNSLSFFTFALPVVFLGILPLLTVLKTVVKKR